jgi:hypothetical protein
MIYALSVAAVAIVYLVRERLKFDTAKKLRGQDVALQDGTTRYPGQMAYANKGGEYFHGCRVAKFKDVNELNQFFLPGNPGHLMLVGELVPASDGILCVFTSALSEEEKEDVADFSREKHAFLAEKKRKRLEEKARAEEDKLRQEAEEKRLAEVGRKCEHNHKKSRDAE